VLVTVLAAIVAVSLRGGVGLEVGTAHADAASKSPRVNWSAGPVAIWTGYHRASGSDRVREVPANSPLAGSDAPWPGVILALLALGVLLAGAAVATRATPRRSREAPLHPVPTPSTEWAAPARAWRAVPLDADGRADGAVPVALADPTATVLAALEARLERRVVPRLCDEGTLDELLNRVYATVDADEVTRALREEAPELSAFRTTLSRPQAAVAFVLGFALVVGALADIRTTATVLVGIATAFFVASTGFRLYAAQQGSRARATVDPPGEDLAAMNERELPLYTVLLPPQLAEPDEDPHDDRRRLGADGRLERPAAGSAGERVRVGRRPRRGGPLAARATPPQGVLPDRRHDGARAARARGAARRAGDWTGAIRTGRPPMTDGHAGLRVLRVLEAAQASLFNGSAPMSPPSMAGVG